MKKFMIFLLMAFLYLGTCQARSESAHPNNAKLKLLSWVSPTPSQSFLTRSNAAPAASFSIKPAGVDILRLGTTANSSAQLTASYPQIEGRTFEWFLDGESYATGRVITVSGLFAQELPYKMWCVATTGDQIDYSDTLAIIVSQHDFTVYITGPNTGCENDVVTLTAYIPAEQAPITGFNYQWFVHQEPIEGETGPNFSFRPADLFEGSTNNVHDISVKVSYANCVVEEGFIDFTVIPQPVVTINGPQFLCKNNYSYDYTAIVDGPQPDHYVWTLTKNGDEVATYTTVENQISLGSHYFEVINPTVGVAVDTIRVKATYNNTACNSEIASIAAPKAVDIDEDNYPDVTLTYAGTKHTLMYEDPEGEGPLNRFVVCQGSEMVLSLKDDNIQHWTNSIYDQHLGQLVQYDVIYRLRDILTGVVMAEYHIDANHAMSLGSNAILHFFADMIGEHNYNLTAEYEGLACEMTLLPLTINVVGAPVVNVTGNNVICAGDTARLTANAYYTNTALGEYSYLENELGFKYIWSDNPNDTLDVNTKKVTEDGQYMVVVFDSVSGCTADAEFSVVTFGGDLQVTASEYQVCPGTVVSLNANLDGWNNDNIQYLWSNGSTGSTLAAAVDRDSIFTVKAYILGNNNDTLCSMTQQINVTVINEVLSAITVNADTNVCLGEQVTARITDNTVYDGLYNWYFNGIEIPGQHLDSITLTMNTVGTHVFAAKRANFQCVLDTVKASKTVTVNAIPEITVTGDNVICQNDTATIMATNITDAKYIWNGPAITSEDTTYMLKTTIPGVYSVAAKAGECVSAPVTFNVMQLGGDLHVYASEVNVCPGTRVILSADLDGFGNQNIAYEWTKVGATAPFDSAATTSVIPEPAQNQHSVVYTVTATATTEDHVSAAMCQLSANIEIFVIDTTPISLTATVIGKDKICQGGQASARVQVNGNAHVDYFTWFINGIEVPGQNLDTIVVNLNEPGDYIFSVKPAENICFAQAAVNADKPVKVQAIPDLAISGNTTICNGDTARVIVTPSIAGTYQYSWQGPANNAVDSLLKTVNDGVYTVTVNNSVCTATTDVTIYRFGADLQIMADKMEICDGEQVVLTAALDGFNNENVEYTWSNNQHGSTIYVNPDVTSHVYSVTASAGNCSMTDTLDILVHARPNDVTVQRVATPDTVCEGSQVTVKVVPTTEDYSYAWYVNGIEVPGENRPIFTMNMEAPGNYKFAALAVNQFGCAARHVTDEAHVAKVNVQAIPELTIAGNTTICNGDTAKVIVTPSVPGVYEYTWQGPANNAVDSLLKTVNDGVYTVTAANRFCTATTDVTIYRFGGDLHIAADKLEICEGEQVVLTANLDGFNNENIEYTWSNNETGSMITVNPSTRAHSYSVTASAGNCSLNDEVDITVHALPSVVAVNLESEESTVCQGAQVTVKVDPARPAYEYLWYVNGIQVPGENRSTFTMNMNETGNFSFAALAINQYGCAAERASYGDGVTTVTVEAAPIVTLTGNHYYTVGATTATITANVLPEIDGEYTYAWNTGEATPEITVNHYGVYTVTVTSPTGCTTVSEPFTVSSVEDLQVHIEGADNACYGDIVTLSAIVDMDLEGHTYQWFMNDQAIDGANGPHYTFNTSNLSNENGDLTFDFTVEINREACAPVVSPVHQLTVHPTPLAVVVADTICKDADAVLQAIVYSIGDNAQYQYVWYKDNAENPIDTVEYINTITIAAEEVEGHTYAVQVLFQDITCSSPISEFVTIPVYSVPARIDLALNPEAICTTNQGELTITDNNDLETFGAVFYDWYMNGIHVNNVNGSFYRADFDHNGIYEFWATATYANYPCAVIYSDTVTENVNMHPTVMITGDQIICEGTAVQLYAQLNDTVGTMDYTYEWRLYNYTLGTETEEITSIYIDSHFPFIHTVTEEVPSPEDNPLFLDHYMISNAFNATDRFVALNLDPQDHPYIFQVVVTTPEGCRTVSEPYFVYVNEHPTVVATVDYDTVCREGEITAMAHLGNYNMDNLTFQWQVRQKHNRRPFWHNDWENIPYGTEPILHHVPGVTSQYRVIVTQTTSECVAISDPVEVEVITPVAIDHIVAINGNVSFPTDNVCEGAQLIITAYVPQLDENGNVMYDDNHDTIFVVDNDHEYVWDLNGIRLNDVHTATFSAQAGIYDNDPVDYTYTAYIVYDLPGCDIVPVSSNTVHVKRNPYVQIDGNPNVCYRGRYEANVILLAWVDGTVDTDAVYTWYESGHMEANTINTEINQYRAAKPITHDNPYIYTVEVTNGDGCTTMSDPFYVNVYAAPEVNITGSEAAICNGGEVELHANLNNYHDPLLTFQWYRDEVNDGHLMPGFTHEVETIRPDQTTDYIVEVTHLMNAFHDEEYCVAYDTFHVEVNKIPEVYAVNDLAGVTSICEGRNITMMVDSIANGVPGGEVYTWYRNGEVVENVNGPIFVDSPVAVDGEPTEYIYAVSMVQAASGCESEIFIFEDAITVNPNPAIELVTDPIVCIAQEGVDNITLLANVVSGSTTTVGYEWYENNNLMIAGVDYHVTSEDNKITLHKPYRDYPYSFSVTLTSDYGCVSESSALVYVNDAPIVNITATDTNICVGGEVTLAASLNDWNADQLTFQWYDDTVAIDGATSLSCTVAPAEGNHSYRVDILQLTSECTATSNVINVHVVADPVVDSISYNIPAENVVCDGYQVNLTAHIHGGVAGGEVYTWYRNGQVIEGAVAAQYTEVVSALNGEPTNYTYAVSVAQTAPDCESSVFTLNAFTVNPNPTVRLVTDPIVCEANEGTDNIVLVANIDPEVATAVTFKWFEDNAEMVAGTDYRVISVDTISLYKPYRDYAYNFAVQVVNGYACSASSEASVSVNANPVVTINVDQDNICETGVITLSAALADWNADQLTFQWYDDTVAIDGATSLTYTYAPEIGNHTYTLKVKQLTSECEATSNVVPVIVNARPRIDVVAVSDINVCYGAQLTISATTNVNDSAAVYTWFRNGVLMEGAVAATIYDTPGLVDNDIQHYVYSAYVTLPQAGCFSDVKAADVAVNVYPNPRVQITGDQHVCETDSVFLIANVDTIAHAAGRLNYTWYMDGQLRDNMQYNLGNNNMFAEYLYARTEPYKFTVDVWRDDVATGCISHSEEYFVYVYPQPVVTITATETEICTNGQVTLTANLNDYNADNITYQWYEVRTTVVRNAVDYDPDYDDYTHFIYEDDTITYHYNIPGATSATYTTNVAETTIFGVNVIQTNSTCDANDEIMIFVHEIPVVTDIKVNGMDTITVCDGAQVTVDATISAYDATGAVYTWYRNGVEIEGANGPIFSENVYTTDNHVTVNHYSAIVTLPASGCVSEMSVDAGVVNINPAPTTVYIAGNNVICEGDTTVLTAYSDVEGTFYWSNGISDTNAITVPAGSYTVTLRTAEGCEMSSENFVVEALGTDLLVSASRTSICQGEHTTLYVNQDGWQGNVTYAWDAQAGNSTATTVDVTPDSTTTYTVTATVNSTNGSCSVTGEVTIVVNELPGKLQLAAATATTICEGGQVTINATPNTAAGYIWYQNGIEIPGENQASITINFNEAGNYHFAAKAISAEGCVSAEASDALDVIVTPAPSQVTIAGNNVLCEGDTTVLTAQSDVNGIFVWSTGDTATTVTVPAGTYNVTMITAEGCQLTSENFTVESFGTDLIVSASATAICEGEHTTLYVDQDGWQGNVTYQWDAQAGNSTAATVDVAPDTTTTYHVTATVTNNNGSCTANGEVTIVVTKRPATVVVTATETTICEGNQITFNAAPADAYGYIWYQNGVEIPGENQATLTVNFNEAGNYSFAAKALNDQNCESAEASAPVAVVVTPAPGEVTIAGINVLCENQTTTLTAQSDVNGIFVWSTGDTATTVTVPAGSYTVTMITAEGCRKTSDNFNVTAFGTDLIVSATETSICEGDHTTLSVDQEGWQGNVAYTWSTGSHAATIDVQPDTTTTYTVTATVTSTNGNCSANGEITIIVNPRPVVMNPIVVTPDTVCIGQQYQVAAIVQGGFADVEGFIWYENGTEIAGENQFFLTLSQNEPGLYRYAAKAISHEGCVSENSSAFSIVRVLPAPTVAAITGNNVICQGDSTTLTAHTDLTTGYTFVWNDGTTGATKVVEAGVYNVTVVTNEGCEMTSENFTVEAFGTQVLVSATATNICEGEHTTLSVEQNGWIGNVEYEWSTGSHATTIDVQPDSTTTYTVTATVTNAAGMCQAVGEVTINVNPKPATPIVAVAFDSICTGSQEIALIVQGPNNLHVTWYMDGFELPGMNTAQILFNAEEGMHLISATVTSEEGCVSDRSLPTAEFNGRTLAAYYVGVSAPESVEITGVNNFCDGGNTTLYANVTATAPASEITYAWFKDGVAMNNVPTADHITVTAAGSYKVIATVSGMCSTESMSYDVTVAEAPQLQLTATETTICAGGTTVITAEATGWNNGDVNYNWSNNFQGSEYTFVPTIAGNYEFVVTASQATSGCVATDTINITVNAVPAAPQITVDNAVICDGGQVTLTINNADPNATYEWYRNGARIIGANQATLTESPETVAGDATNYVYTAKAILPMSGCESEMSANTIVNVVPTPVVAVAVEGNTTLCVGGSTTLHANVTPAAAYSYQWYKDNVEILGANTADYTVSEVARETAYNFTVVVSANPGCNVTAAAPAITVVADPEVMATISNDITCVGGVATLNAVVDGGVAGVNGLNGYTYQWHRNDVDSTIATTAEFTTTGTEAAGNYTYWVTVTSNYGCQTTSAPVNYSVIADPVVTINVAQGYPTTVCEGGASALKANVFGGYGEISYQWYKNGNILPGETNQILNIDALAYGNSDVYTVNVAQTGVGCESNATAALNTLVTVHAPYTVDITGFDNVCEGGTLTLNATVNTPIFGDVLSYQWYKIQNGSEQPISGAINSYYSTSDLLLNNSYDYYVVVTSSISGCSVVSNSVTANVVAAPTVVINGANTVCEGGNLTLNAFVNGGVEGADYTYTWEWTGAANGSAVTADPTFVPSVAANDAAAPYYFTVTISRADNTGCTATSEAHEVNVLAVPTVTVTADNNYVCENGQVTFTAHVSPVGTYNYVWTINGQQQAENAAVITTSLANAGTINASVEVSAANASASCFASATIAVPVQVVAAPTVAISADHTAMCVGGTTTLTANITANGNIPTEYNYQWAINGIEVEGAVANTFVQPLNAAGTYTYTLRVSQDNNLGCASVWSAPVTVQVAEQPVVTLSSADGLAICEGGSITLTGVVTNYGTNVNGVTNSNIYGNLTFDWTSNGINVHHNTNVNNAMNQVTETLNNVGNYSYQVVVTPTGYNCLPQTSNVEMVNVVNNPSWTEVHVYGSHGVDACIGEIVTLNAEIQGGAFDAGYNTNGQIQWTVTDGNGNVANVSGGLGGNSYDVPAAPGTYTYTPTFIGNIGSGCQMSNTGAVQVAMTIHDLPTATFTAGDGASLCANDPSASVALEITFNGVAPFNYQVVDASGNVVAQASTMANTATIYVAPTEQTTYMINFVADAFCENTSLDAAATATVFVNEIEFSENFFESGCNDNGTVTIHFNMIHGNPTAAFTVVYDNGLQASGNISNNTATFTAPTVPGDYNAVFTVDGCSYNIVVRVLAGDYAFGGSLPIMDQRWNDVVVVNNNPATNGGHTFVGFQWYRNGVAIPGATYSNYQEIGGLNGFYSVELTERDANGNMITYKTCEMYFNSVSSVKVYPVPANVRQEITIELDLTSEELEGAVLDIYSVTGALIDHVTNLQPITKIEGFKAQGTYFGRILTGTNEIKTVKFVIVK